MTVTKEQLETWINAQLPLAEAEITRTHNNLKQLGLDENTIDILTQNEDAPESVGRPAREKACAALGLDPNDPDLTDSVLYDETTFGDGHTLSEGLLARHRYQGLMCALDNLDSYSIEEVIQRSMNEFGLDIEGEMA